MAKHYPFLSLRLANEPLVDELKAAATSVVESGWYLNGEQTRTLEKEIAQMCGTRYCVAVSNGLDALRLILRAYKELGRLADGDGVIVPANTYIATILAITDNNLRPVLCEPDPSTLNLDTSLVESLVTPDVKAVMPVHLYGTPCYDATLRDVATRHNLLVIEDNAQAIGAEAAVEGKCETRRTGGLGDAAGISFYPTKNVGALGDAGAVTTNDETLANSVRALANYGSDRRYHNIFRGYNCRIDEIQAAMLRVKVRHLDRFTDQRREVVRVYDSAITNPLVIKPRIFNDMRQVWHQYVVRVKNRDSFRDFLQARGVDTDIHYATPPHLQPCYSCLEHDALPITERLADEVVSLPVAYPISADDAAEIAEIINQFQA